MNITATQTTTTASSLMNNNRINQSATTASTTTSATSNLLQELQNISKACFNILDDLDQNQCKTDLIKSNELFLRSNIEDIAGMIQSWRNLIRNNPHINTTHVCGNHYSSMYDLSSISLPFLQGSANLPINTNMHQTSTSLINNIPIATAQTPGYASVHNKSNEIHSYTNCLRQGTPQHIMTSSTSSCSSSENVKDEINASKHISCPLSSAESNLSSSIFLTSDSIEKLDLSDRWDSQFKQLKLTDAQIIIAEQKLSDLNSLRLKDEETLTFHLREIESNVSSESILGYTADQLALFDKKFGEVLKYGRIDNSMLSKSDQGRILCVRFSDTHTCKKLKQCMDAHVRQLYQNYALKHGSKNGQVTNPEKHLYRYVQAFIIGCPEPIRKLKRSLRAQAQLLHDKVSIRLPNYIGTPILDKCNKKYTPFAEPLKQALCQWTAIHSVAPNLVKNLDVVVCDSTNHSNGRLQVKWISFDEAVSSLSKEM